MRNVMSFLNELIVNNNREWFEANRAWYGEVQAEFNSFIEQMIEGLASFDSSIEGVTVKDCVYRIYRDTRFSKDKQPYKTHIGAYVAPKGKKSGYAGYYFHVEPKGDGLIGGNVLAAGLYCPEPKVMLSVRDEILDNGASFVSTMHQAESFELDFKKVLKRVPRGFPADSEYAEYLKLKDFSLMRSISDEFLLSDDLLENTLHEFKKTMPFNHLLNRAVEFAYEQM